MIIEYLTFSALVSGLLFVVLKIGSWVERYLGAFPHGQQFVAHSEAINVASRSRYSRSNWINVCCRL